jgi:hypothetical protein
MQFQKLLNPLPLLEIFNNSSALRRQVFQNVAHEVITSLELEFGSKFEQKLDYFWLVLAQSVEQWSEVVLGFDVHSGSVLKQFLGTFNVFVVTRSEQCSFPIFTLLVHVSSLVYQKLYEIQTAESHRRHKQGV